MIMLKINMFARFIIVVFLLTTEVFTINAQQSTVNLDSLNAYFEKCVKDWQIPGIAIAIVKNDSVIFAKGYGVRDILKGGKVDENTMFGIASNTKAFTSAALATLVDQGKLSWDDKVIKHLPYFQLYDPYVTNEMTVRDLLCHRSGLKTFSGDLLWDASNYNREEIIRRARFLKPTYGFRSHFGYSNVMFLTAGEIIPAITGKSYDDYLKDVFFTPLGMKITNTTIKKHKETENVAIPHVKVDGKTVAIPYISWDNIAPAGAINSSVIDMSKWIKLQLNRGTLNGKQYFSKKTSSEMWKPQTLQDVSQVDASIHFHAYGLGWDLFDFHGKKIVNHNGGLDGMISQVVLVPEEKLGFVVLTNSINYLPTALMYKITEEFLGIKEKDYSSLFLSYIKMSEAADLKAQQDMEAKRIKNTKPSLSLDKYVGTYEGDLYGKATISLKNNKLVVQLVPTPSFESELEHWQFDTFRIKFKAYPSLPYGTINFVLDAEGNVEKMRIDVPNPDFDFTELEFNKIN